MKDEIARHVVATAFGSQKPLADLVPLLKQHCAESEYKTYVKSIAKIMDTINTELVDPIFSSCPEVKTAIEADMEAYDRIL